MDEMIYFNEQAKNEDVMRLEAELKEAQELIKTLYNFLGSSADSDHRLWMKTKEYCFKKKLVSYPK